jgi:predicted GTPase
MNLNEKILTDCYNLYNDTNIGLVNVGKQVGIKLTSCRKRLNILLIGNHSAGKSSFINWYINGKFNLKIIIKCKYLYFNVF